MVGGSGRIPRVNFMTSLTRPLWVLAVAIALPIYGQDPLPSWNDTAPKKAIVSFVEKVTKEAADKAKEALEAAGATVSVK